MDDPRIDPADLRNAHFPGSSRRYDAKAVDQFLRSIADRVAATNTLVDELERQVAEARARAETTPARAERADLSELDDDALVRLVGDETMSVLSTARRAAEEIRSKAEESASRVIRDATDEARSITDEAEARVRELTADAEGAHERAVAAAEGEAERIRRDAESDAHRLLAEAREEARTLLEAVEIERDEAREEAALLVEEAREEGRSMLEEAKEVRGRILQDLQRRRDLARAQVERLDAGRRELLEIYALIRSQVDDITGRLSDEGADDDALDPTTLPDLPDGFVGIVRDATEPVGVELEVDIGVDVDAGNGPDADDADPDVDDAVHADGSDVEDDLDDAAAADDAAPADQAVRVDDAVPADDAVPVDDAVPAEEETPVGGGEDGGYVDDTVAPTVPSPPLVVPVPGADVASDRGEEDRAEDTVETGETGGAGADVDALFARLRAEREQSVARAHLVLEPPDDADATESEPVASVAVDDQPTDNEAAGSDPAHSGPVDRQPVDSTPTDRQVDRVPDAFLAPGGLLESRADVLESLGSALARRLKRHLADEQNEVLDLLRRTGSTSVDELLPGADDHVGAYAQLAAVELGGAATAGAASVDRSAVAPDVSELAQTLGSTLVEPFRRRLERATAEVGDDADELDERLRALYREWKVQHIGPAVNDALLSAYARGVHAAAPPNASLRWLIDPEQGPCPDAQDNALAGAVGKGESFPTGDECPQAHPGCRCLLAVDRD